MMEEDKWNDLNGSDRTQYHYVIVRGDLPKGVMGAQIVHAAGESASPKPTEGCHAILLEAKDEEHLLFIMGRLKFHKIPFEPVLEVDPPYADQYMAIGINPTTNREAIRKVVSDLPLVK